MNDVYFKPSEDFLEKANKVFEKQKRRINKLLPYADIQHIGSTSIPGSITKGDLDIVVRVDPEKFDEAVNTLKQLYQINQPENWLDTFASFKDDNLGIDFGAQLVTKDSRIDDFHKLKDVLKNNKGLLNEYNNLKRKYDGKRMDGYRKEKADFFEKLRRLL